LKSYLRNLETTGVGEMKSIIVAIVVFFAIGGCATNGLSMVEKRVTTIEMPESGQTISFPMTEEEIAAEDAEIASQKATQRTRTKKIQKRVMKVEMGESGQIITFPMTKEEIAIEDDKVVKREKLKHKAARKSKRQFERFEMPESGNYIYFPVKEE
jgi:hypothetical protein